MVKVWDVPQRGLHWLLAAGVAAAWITSETGVKWHNAVGYGALAAATLRVVWGVVGSRHARFRHFVRGPRHTLHYALAMLQRREPRHLGHNPLGAWMVLALLACVLATGVSGWLYTTDAWWGDERVERVHRMLAWMVLALATLHVAGVCWASLRHRENLVRAMLDGIKRAPDEGDMH